MQPERRKLAQFRNRVLSQWRLAEPVLLPYTAPPWPQQVQKLGWKPDPFDTYCDRCGVHVGPNEVDDRGCSHCRGSRPPWDQFVRLSSYEGEMVGWIHQIKFTRFTSLAEIMGRTLGERLLQAGLDGSRALVVPMPTTWRRRVVRGIDHAGDIARGVSRGSGGRLTCLMKRKHCPSQRTLPASGRIRNAGKAAFSLPGRPDLKGWDVILVDDVCTTGATLRAAARVLKKAGPDMLWVAVLAVSDEDARRARRLHRSARS